MTEAIVLAGGLGSRLRSVVADRPKPMADVGGRPFLSYLLYRLAASGINSTVLSIGYMHETITSYFGAKYAGMDISYAIEESPQGTGGGLRDALRLVSGADTLVLNGDTFFAVDLGGIRAAHKESCADLTMALLPMKDFDRYGVVRVEGDRVVAFEEKAPRDFGYVNGGVYVAGRSLATALMGIDGSFSFEAFIERSVGEFDIRAHISDSYFIDIGVPEDYERACREMPDMFGPHG